MLALIIGPLVKIPLQFDVLGLIDEKKISLGGLNVPTSEQTENRYHQRARNDVLPQKMSGCLFAECSSDTFFPEISN